MSNENISDSLHQESQNNAESTKVEKPSLENELEILQQKITEQQQQISELNQKLLRSFADFENLRKRSLEEKEKTHQFAITNFVSDLALVVENFFMASENCPQQEIEKNEAIKNYAIAVDMTKKELIKTLEKYKVARIFPLKQQFDHNLHEALSKVPTQPTIAKDGEILQVIQAGYTIADRLIKPALVIVAQVSEDILPETTNNENNNN
jgi:molecular chaperone GrpE